LIYVMVYGGDEWRPRQFGGREQERMQKMRQRIGARRNRSDTGSSWFRLGVLSATVLAPLIARWNDLRTSSNPQTLRELAAARLAPMRAAANASLDDARGLAIAKLGDVRTAARPRVGEALDRLAQVRTPEVLKNVPPFSLATKRAGKLERQRQQRRQTALFWLAGVGMLAAGATAYVLARRWMSMPVDEDDEQMVEIPPEREMNLIEATVGKAPEFSLRNA
jgi:hypothetical protein